MAHAPNILPPAASIIGDYSPWPRRPKPRRTFAFAAGAAAAFGVFLHCIAPMTFGF